jgi:hypothetical protein
MHEAETKPRQPLRLPGIPAHQDVFGGSGSRCLDGEISAQADDQDDKQLSREKAIDGFEHDATSLLL